MNDKIKQAKEEEEKRAKAEKELMIKDVEALDTQGRIKLLKSLPGEIKKHFGYIHCLGEFRAKSDFCHGICRDRAICGRREELKEKSNGRIIAEKAFKAYKDKEVKLFGYKQ